MEIGKLIGLYRDAFMKEECEYFIDLYKSNLSHVNRFTNENYDFHQLQLIKAGHRQIANNFALKVKAFADSYFERMNLSNFIPKYGFEEVRIKHYTSDMEFSTHVDVADLESSKRFLIAILYLNDNDGYTTFDNLGIKVKPEMGSLILFPPYWMFPHSGQKCSTEKYIMMTSLNYLPSGREGI